MVFMLGEIPVHVCVCVVVCVCCGVCVCVCAWKVCIRRSVAALYYAVMRANKLTRPSIGHNVTMTTDKECALSGILQYAESS